jgi:hypothetical protein
VKPVFIDTRRIDEERRSAPVQIYEPSASAVPIEPGIIALQNSAGERAGPDGEKAQGLSNVAWIL